MSSKREQIMAALKAKLVSITGVSDANVYRSRVTPLARGITPAVVIEPVQDNPSAYVIPIYDWSLTVRVSVIVHGDIGDQAADQIIIDVHSKLTSDLSLGGLCMDIQPGIVNYQLLEGDGNICVASLDYIVRYRTLTGDLTT